ncbi:pentatricopeptide repeat-containing protein At4g15720-like [Oryza brachyantha]|uniref:pentatricopeptide repeat-containing protein At4g15720-like n=1 Tax=Oryza brachyantha TaxID=4533 RepID=UPI001ADA6E20|nr:pentatricopeptide repeat-containing protein At4g15720-like [Oryza brachyantha]
MAATPKAAAAATLMPLLIHLLRGASDLASVSATHAKLLKLGADASVASSNHLLAAYCRCGSTAPARRLFDGMPDRNVVSWTALMSGYASAGRPRAAVALLRAMVLSGVAPNAFTFSTAASACARLADAGLGRQVHACAEVAGYACDNVVATALVDMYGKAGSVRDARAMFDAMPATARNIVSWASMLSVYAQNALGHDAIQLFAELRSNGEDMAPNHFILSSVVSACAGVGRLGIGRCLHGMVLRHGHEDNDVVAVALVDMYSKCGCYEYSKKVFDNIKQPSVISYTSIIVATAKYGLGRCALALFSDMVDRGVQPNSVTLLGVLHACSHSGLVDIGLHLLHSMRSKYGIDPCASHYTCAVDMLGRAGQLEEAFELANEARLDGNDDLLLWSSLLSSCRNHKRLDLATKAGKKVSEFSQDVAGALVVMSNAYASAGQADDAAAVWSNMRQRSIRKDPGCSWIEIKDVPYVFYAGVASPAGARADDVMLLLDELETKMREKGYKGRIGGARVLDADEEVDEDHHDEGKGVMVGVHSEMLTLGFGLLVIPKGMIIRVMKNLRMCCGCHEAFKLISDIMEREFVVRDLNRFHHFRRGSCSCN